MEKQTTMHKIYISTEEEVDNFQKKKNDDLYEYKYDEESTTYIPVSPRQRRKQLNNGYLQTIVTILLLMLILPFAFHKLYYSQSTFDKDFVDCHKNLSNQNNHPLTNLLDNTNNHNRQIFSMFEDLDTIRDYELRNKLINRKHMML